MPLSHLKYRPDIDGLRTIAVLSVVIFHAFPSLLGGGFVGVDVFFVISGYLISSLIFKELLHQPQGAEHFNFRRFYARRTRRIFPALVLILLFSLVAGWFVLLADEYKELGKEVVAGAAFLENISLWQEAGYFDTSAELKPMLHLWSLGVEEQFYLGWPILLVLALRRRLDASIAILVLALLSFSANIFSVHVDATAAFYSPISRVWQFMAGAALASMQSMPTLALARGLSRLKSCCFQSTSDITLSNWRSMLGIALILSAAFCLNKSVVFPGWWALLPTVGAYLVISAGPHAWANRHVLGSRPFVFIGLISYPLYLWHWPSLYFVRILHGENSAPIWRVAAILCALILSYLTYRLVERQLRFKDHWVVTFGLALSLALMAGIGHNIFDRDGLQFRLKGSELQRVKFNITLSYQEQCRRDFPFAANSFCLRGSEDTEPTVALIGDSHAQSLYQGLGAMYETKGENLVNFGAGGGIPLFGIERISDGNTSGYGKIFDPAFDYALANRNIHTIILMNKSVNTDQEKEPLRYGPAPEITDPVEAYGKALAHTLEKLQAAHKQVIFVIDNPLMDFDPAECVPRPSGLDAVKQPCAITREQYEHDAGPYRRKVLAVLGNYPEVRVWDLTKYLCDDKYCWAMKDGKMLYNRDGTHLSVVGSHWLAERFSPY